MLLVNKVTIHLLPAPAFMLLCQLSASAAVVFAGAQAGWLKADAFERDKLRKFAPVVVGFLGGLFANAKVLSHANVETFIVVRASSPLVVALSDWYFLGRALPDQRSAGMLLLVLAGASAYVYHDATINLPAALWCLVWMAFFTFDQCYIKHVCDTVEMTAWGRVLYSNALAILPCIFIAAANGELAVLPTLSWSPPALAALAFSCACGIVMSFTSYSLRALVSATSFTLIGILCKFGTVTLNFAIWDKHTTLPGLAALSLCLVAGSLYTPAPLRATPAAK